MINPFSLHQYQWLRWTCSSNNWVASQGYFLTRMFYKMSPCMLKSSLFIQPKRVAKPMLPAEVPLNTSIFKLTLGKVSWRSSIKKTTKPFLPSFGFLVLWSTSAERMRQKQWLKECIASISKTKQLAKTLFLFLDITKNVQTLQNFLDKITLTTNLFNDWNGVLYTTREVLMMSAKHFAHD